MNGATADPWVSTTRPPNSTITSSIGSSQNFLRIRRNRHSSARKDIGVSELIGHGRAGVGLAVARNPVAGGLGIEAPVQRILAEQPQQQRRRGERKSTRLNSSH